MYKINQRMRLWQKQDKLQNRFIHLSTGLVRANTEDNRAHDNTAQPRLASAFPAEDHGGTGTTARRSPSSNTTTCSRPHARHPRPLLCTWQGRRGYSKARALEETSPSKRFNTSNNFQHTDFSRFFRYFILQYKETAHKEAVSWCFLRCVKRFCSVSASPTAVTEVFADCDMLSVNNSACKVQYTSLAVTPHGPVLYSHAQQVVRAFSEDNEWSTNERTVLSGDGTRQITL